MIKNRLIGSLMVLVMSLGFCYDLRAQDEITVKGTVIGEDDNAPVPGATVLIDGTTTGTITDIDGKYTIKAKYGDILKFSFVGMQDMSREVTGEKLDITLVSDIQGLDEVVVIGYGQQRQKEVTGAVARVKAEVLERTITSDVANALQGQIAGVSVTSSTGAPGAVANIQIRGIASVFGGNEPLWVVDGIPQSGNPQLASNEIETIDVLKDAASAAVYGTRGAAGVIVVTTKKGGGKLKVDVNSSYGIRNITASTPVMNAREQEYFEIIQDANISDTPKDQVSSGYARTPYSILNDTDLKEIVYVDDAATQDHNVNITGGTNEISYNLAAGYYKQEGVIINSDFERINARASTSYNKGKWNVRGIIGYQTQTTDQATSGMFTQTTRYWPSQQTLRQDQVEPVQSNGWGAGAAQVGWVLNSLNNTDVLDRDRMQTSFNVTFEILEGLKLMTNYGGSVTHQERNQFNKYTPHFDPEGVELSNPDDGFVQNTSEKFTSSSIDYGASYTKSFGDHNVTLTAFASFEKYTREGFRARKTNIANNSIQVLNIASNNPLAESLNNSVNTINGLIGRVQYNYKGKYLFSGNVRRDGSSRFGSANRFEVFPSTSAGWMISEENFWTPVKPVIESLKFRGSWGNTGNQSFGDYAYAATIGNGIDYTFGESSAEAPLVGAAQEQYANALVQWETSRQTNIGLDMELFNGKWNITADYYTTKKENMLFNVTLPPSTGAIGGNSTVVLNVGNMTNEGYELAIGYRNRFNELDVNINGTFMTNENVITKMKTDGYIFTSDGGIISGDGAARITALAEGYEAGSFFLLKSNGVAKTQEQLEAYQQFVPTAKLGDLMYVDTNGDSLINNDDRVYHGSGLPDYEIGLNMNLEYKGFDFIMQWYGAFGQEIMNGSHADASSFGRHKELLYSWSPANPDSDIPAYRGSSKDHPNYWAYSDRYIEDGSYVRLRLVTLGYTIPKALSKRVGVEKFRIYVSAQNPLTITNYDGFDPEVGGNGLTSRGLDKGNYPVTSFYLMGVNLQF
ncbi:MAG: TonB-dependent receptor [Cyclobacteriaceae bacterium]